MDDAPVSNAPPPEHSALRHVPLAVAIVGFLALGLCLIGATRTKIRSDAEDAVIRDWDSAARELYSTLRESSPGEPAARAGTLLPIRLDDGAQEGRVDFNVFLALPEAWRPKAGASPAQVVVLRYRNADLRVYGQSAKGGDLIRRRQACKLELYDLASRTLIAERELLSPDPLPEGYRDTARLSVSPEQVVAELRAR